MTDKKTETNEAIVHEHTGEVSAAEVKEEKAFTKIKDKDMLFRVGDTVSVGFKIVEGGSERVQSFEGLVIAKKGKEVSRTFTVRRIGAKNIGVERIFPLHSPKIAYIKVLKKGKVRRAKLYFLRQNRSKKDSKIKEIQ